MKKNNFFRLLSFAILSMFFLPLQAGEPEIASGGHLMQYDRVVVVLHDGKTYEIGIDGSSSIKSYEEEAGQFVLVVYGTGSYYYTFAREEVKTLKFLESEDQSIIEDLQEIVDEHSSKIIMGKDGLQFHPSTQGKVCLIQDLSGKVIRCFVVDSPYVMRCDEMPRGIYLVTVENYTLKIMLR